MKAIQSFVVILLAVLLLGCEQQNQEIIVGTSADNPPYEFIQNGEIVGMDIDIINAIAAHINKKIIIKNLDFPGLLAALASKNIDIAIAALSVTLERSKVVDFSYTYMVSNVSVLYREVDNFNNYNNLENKTVGVQLGSTWALIAEDLSKELNLKINSLANNLMLVEELKSKVVDAVILEEEQCKKFIKQNPELSDFSMPESFSSKFAIAMQKDSQLKIDIDNAIAYLKKNGALDKIERKWISNVR